MYIGAVAVLPTYVVLGLPLRGRDSHAVFVLFSLGQAARGEQERQAGAARGACPGDVPVWVRGPRADGRRTSLRRWRLACCACSLWRE